jgi:hypothetical protein
MAPSPKKFSQKPFYPVPHHRVANFGADSNSQSALSAFIVRADDDEVRGVNLLTGPG